MHCPSLSENVRPRFVVPFNILVKKVLAYTVNLPRNCRDPPPVLFWLTKDLSNPFSCASWGTRIAEDGRATNRHICITIFRCIYKWDWPSFKVSFRVSIDSMRSTPSLRRVNSIKSHQSLGVNRYELQIRYRPPSNLLNKHQNRYLYWRNARSDIFAKSKTIIDEVTRFFFSQTPRQNMSSCFDKFSLRCWSF